MPSDDLVKYFIKHTNERFDALEGKVDRLISFRWMLIGVSLGVSGVVSFLFQVFQAVAGGK